MSRVPGVLPAIVKSVADPNNMGRIKVQFDWMDDAPVSYWARVAAPMAGKARGCFFMPEVDDEVLVAFEHGDVAFPYIVGYCWSGVDKPPFDADQHKRGVKTVAGHKLIFDDSSGSSPTVTLTTQGGYQLLLDETGQKITLKTAQGVTVELDDTPPQVQVSLPSGNSITLGPSGLAVNAAAGEVSIQTTSTTITSPVVTIDAALTTITGVLSVGGPTISTGGIISSSYTPGLGNIL